MERAEPRLIAISGPCKGHVWTLTNTETTIGRDSQNEIPIQDRTVSRRHSLVTQANGEFSIRDLESLNGTIVNGIPVQQQSLTHGSRIEVGDSIFVFATQEIEDESALQLSSEEIVSDSTYRMKPFARAEFTSFSPTPEDLKMLLEMNMKLNRALSSTEFWGKFLELIESKVPFDGAAVLLVEQDESSFCIHTLRCKETEVNENIVQQVLKDATGSLLTNIHTVSKSKSILCVPLVQRERPFGVVYLMASNNEAFRPDHLHLLSAMGTIAAVSLELLAERQRLERERERLQLEINSERMLIGESPQMSAVYSLIEKSAQADTTVLICGESGTGKELVARAIHQKSKRNKYPFIAINCAALPETLLESELFGHEKGAFTGAISQVKGRIETANSGTLFLDEIGDMSLTIQAKLLRVLQEREIERVGGRKVIKVDIRVLAATNKELDKLVAENSFRNDLYYRLNVISIRLPALRERKKDIPLLANYFLMKCSQKMKRKVYGFSAEARDYLLQYEWPGNVRELENAIERALVLGCSDTILPEDLPENVIESAASETDADLPFYTELADTKRQMILKALKDSNGNYSKAAQVLGLSRTYLHRLAKNLKLK